MIHLITNDTSFAVYEGEKSREGRVGGACTGASSYVVASSSNLVRVNARIEEGVRKESVSQSVARHPSTHAQAPTCETVGVRGCLRECICGNGKRKLVRHTDA
mmetsp:Transcript_23230/g.37304  ORF Transcript_23230/g.37304 Transcript_23230/m.37304 type:complete len:103 (+) Transcript_23230:4494-4802(+)